MIAYNYIAPVVPEALTIKRKGRVIKGETEARIAQATKERNAMRNALKRERRARVR
jgi:hypothetical protein